MPQQRRDELFAARGRTARKWRRWPIGLILAVLFATMGLFDCRCMVTGVSLKVSEAALILLDGDGTTYRPLALPIFGHYDRAGKIDHVAGSENSGRIFSYFAKKLETGDLVIDSHQVTRFDSLNALLHGCERNVNDGGRALLLKKRPIAFALIARPVWAAVARFASAKPQSLEQAFVRVFGNDPVPREIYGDDVTSLGPAVFAMDVVSRLLATRGTPWQPSPAAGQDQAEDMRSLLAAARKRCADSPAILRGLVHYESSVQLFLETGGSQRLPPRASRTASDARHFSEFWCADREELTSKIGASVRLQLTLSEAESFDAKGDLVITTDQVRASGPMCRIFSPTRFGCVVKPYVLLQLEGAPPSHSEKGEAHTYVGGELTAIVSQETHAGSPPSWRGESLEPIDGEGGGPEHAELRQLHRLAMANSEIANRRFVEADPIVAQAERDSWYLPIAKLFRARIEVAAQRYPEAEASLTASIAGWDEVKPADRANSVTAALEPEWLFDAALEERFLLRQRMGKHDEALEDAERLAKWGTENGAPWYLARQAEALAARGKMDEAVKGYGDVLAKLKWGGHTDSRNNGAIARSLLERGRILRTKGKLDLAQSDFAKLASLVPERPDAPLEKGRTLEALGRLREAELEYQQASVLARAAAKDHALATEAQDALRGIQRKLSLRPPPRRVVDDDD